MKLEDGETTVGSLLGFCLSIITALAVLGFAYTKAQTLFERKEVDIITSIARDHFQDNEEFSSADNGFFLAAALTNYDSNTEVLEKPEYGELLIEHYGWGNADIGYSYGSHPLPNRFCSREEIGLERTENTKIYPIYERSIPEVETYSKKFKCIDSKSQVIWGDYNSAKAMQLAVKFHMCSGHDYCKSKDEIRDWISGMYIVLLYNQVRFDSEEVWENSKIKESRILYIPVSSQTR